MGEPHSAEHVIGGLLLRAQIAAEDARQIGDVLEDRLARDQPEVLKDEARYCSFGDTVHYLEPPKIFARCEGSFLYDTADRPYLDLQMWYSAVNFGYGNARLNAALKKKES